MGKKGEERGIEPVQFIVLSSLVGGRKEKREVQKKEGEGRRKQDVRLNFFFKNSTSPAFMAGEIERGKKGEECKEKKKREKRRSTNDPPMARNSAHT